MKIREAIQARAVVVLKSQGFTEAEIAIALGVGRTTIQNRKKLARAVAERRPRVSA